MDSLEINESGSEEKTSKPFATKTRESFHWYLSDAEVQVNSWRFPLWQKSKISFYVMDSPRANSCKGGEFEIEKVPLHEVEIKCKELLPVFDHFHGIKPGWNDRCFAEGKHPLPLSPLDPHQYKASRETIFCHSEPASLSSTESYGGGSSRRLDNLLDLDQINCEKSYTLTYHGLHELCREKSGNCIIEPLVMNQESLTIASSPFRHSENIYPDNGHFVTTGFPSSENKLPSLRNMGEGTLSLNAGGIGDALALHVDHYDAPTNIPADASSFSTEQNLVDIGHFQEGHYEILRHKECSKLTEVVNDDVDSSSNHCGEEKLEEDLVG